MSDVFGQYSNYYDLLYKDKDYQSEAMYIHKLLAADNQSILELGCGTGAHAAILAETGHSIHGIDLSDTMLEKAASRQQELPTDIAERLTFAPGNVCNYRIDKSFDAVVSLFHVVSYQTTNDALTEMFETARMHLKKGGSFLFDCWYGPTVLSEKPATRVKRLENANIKVTRIAEPEIYPNQNIVDVNYSIFIEDKESGLVEQLKETHKMRYLFTPEIEALLKITGFELTIAEEWLTGQQPGFDTWGVCYKAKAI